MEHISIKPVLYISVATIPPSNTKGEKLINDLKKYAKERHYLEAPEAWFVPIAYLKTRIDDVVDFLHFEAVYYKEFEIWGGFEITSPDGYSLGPPGDLFICAMQLAEAIIDLQENENKEVSIDNDRFMKLSHKNGKISMVIGHRARYIPPKELVVPSEELKNKMEIARNELVQFVSQLEPLLIQFDDFHIYSRNVKYMLGLEKISPKENRA